MCDSGREHGAGTPQDSCVPGDAAGTGGAELSAGATQIAICAAFSLRLPQNSILSSGLSLLSVLLI